MSETLRREEGKKGLIWMKLFPVKLQYATILLFYPTQNNASKRRLDRFFFCNVKNVLSVSPLKKQLHDPLFFPFLFSLRCILSFLFSPLGKFSFHLDSPSCCYFRVGKKGGFRVFPPFSFLDYLTQKIRQKS